MKFTLTIPDPIFQGCQQLAKEHDVRVATILNALIRRGIISCHVSPFVLLHDEYLFKRQLKEQIRDLERAIGEWDGLDLESMEGTEIAAIANGEKSFSDSLPPVPLETLKEEADRELEEMLASGFFDDAPSPQGTTTEEMIAHHLRKMDQIGALIDQKLAAGDDESEDS